MESATADGAAAPAKPVGQVIGPAGRSVTGVDGITLDAGADHVLTFEASSLARVLIS